MIKLENVTKKYKNKNVLNNINLTIEGVYGLLGPNGAGKTSLMQSIAGLISIQSGQITIGDELGYENIVKYRQNIGYLPQDFNTFPRLTVRECLDHIALLKGFTNSKERKKRIERVLEDVNMLHHQNEKMGKLSGGMRKRVGIAQIFLTEPNLLIIDEPTAGLDLYERIRFRNLLTKISLNKTVIISSHIIEDIEFLCTKVGVINEGSVLKEGTPSEIANSALNKIWKIETTKEAITHLIQTYDVINITQLNDDTYEVRVLSDEQPVNSISVLPSLTEGYVSLIIDNERKDTYAGI